MIDTIIFIFCFVDDFCKLYEDALKKFALLSGKRLRKPTRVPRLTMAEIITILLVFQRSKMRDLKTFYRYFKESYIDLFPNLTTCERFNELQKRAFPVLSALLNSMFCKTATVDSTKIDVCHISK